MLAAWRVTEALVLLARTVGYAVANANTRYAGLGVVALEHARFTVELGTFQLIAAIGTIALAIALPISGNALLVGRAALMVATCAVGLASPVVGLQDKIVRAGTLEIGSIRPN